MRSSIYEYRDYKKYLIDLIESSESGSRGKRKLLAEAIGCQVSHITSVLSGEGHFSQEQGEAAARFFGQNARETEFLLLLVQYNRSGTPSLINFYKKLLTEKQKSYSTLKKRLAMPDELRSKQEAIYYSSWYFGAIHILLSIPDFRTRDAVANKLNLPIEKVDEVLSFLVDSGLVKKVGQNYLIERPTIHLDKSSPLISKHHTNWRLRAIMSFDQSDESRLHYSSVVTLSNEDYHKVREIMTKALTKALEVITESSEEDAAVLCLDLFRL